MDTMSGIVDSLTGAAATRQRRAAQRAQADATGRQLAAAAAEASVADAAVSGGRRRTGRRALTFLGTEPQSLG